jgi:hypothetical protein
MKIKLLLLVAAALAGPVLLHADKITGGPKGGRLLDTKPQRAEFFVNKDRKVEVTFLTATLEPSPPGPQTVAITAETPGGRVVLTMTDIDAGYVSAEPLPPGEPYRVVVQVRNAPDSKPQNFRIDLNLATCGECQRAEYACICEGH